MDGLFKNVDKYQYSRSGMKLESNVVGVFKNMFKKQIREGLVHIEHNPLEDVKKYVTKEGRGVDIVIFVAGKKIEIECKNLSSKWGQSPSWCDGEIKKRFSPDADKKYVVVSCDRSISNPSKRGLIKSDIKQIYVGHKIVADIDSLARRNLYRNRTLLSLYHYVKKLLSNNNTIVYGVDSILYIPFKYFTLNDYFKVPDISVKDIKYNVRLKDEIYNEINLYENINEIRDNVFEIKTYEEKTYEESSPALGIINSWGGYLESLKGGLND